MPTIRHFTDLTVWQEARKLVQMVYEATKMLPQAEQFGLVMQLKRAAVSVAANIAEGFSRYSYRDRVHFYHQARGSLAEVESHTLLSGDVAGLSKERINRIQAQIQHVELLLNGLVRATNKRAQA